MANLLEYMVLWVEAGAEFQCMMRKETVRQKMSPLGFLSELSADDQLILPNRVEVLNL